MEALLQHPLVPTLLMFLGVGLQMTNSKLVGVCLIAFSLGWLWQIAFPYVTGNPSSLTDPLLLIGWVIILVGCLLYARFLRTDRSLPSPTPIQLNPPLQSSSTSQGGSVINNITDIPKKRVPPPGVRDAIRSDLKPFFLRGYELLHFYESSKYRDEEPWQEWVQEVNTFFRNSLDESYITRWNNHDGLTVYSELTPFSPLPVEVPGGNRKLYADVAFRLQRLAKFDKELKG